ncbi:hypothetical protein EDD96_4247 [Streptomyces sp. Ag109_G2-6]|uniref:hypothetical protein n=1 Tax=Streptomyces TaxID=1883 RepID=UPI000CC83F6B|nr:MULTISPECIES: hypothetical protein [Streptomyces]RPF40483.1 hypothetical protein EDD96_4247 [Streptomyces sp. Ag109_G2-6]
MSRSPRRLPLAALLLCAAAPAAGGCAAPGGLAAGEPVAPASAQPQPQALWPAWADDSPKSPGAATGTRQPPPAPLADAPEAGPEGLTAVKAAEIVKADPRMRLFADKGTISAPGRSGIRPPVYLDLTGDGHKELIVAADTETGRTALSVYIARGNRIVPVLFTLGRRMAAESLGPDLLIRTAPDDGSEQAVRYHWDGERMTVVNEERRYNKTLPGPDPAGSAPAADRRSGGPR